MIAFKAFRHMNNIIPLNHKLREMIEVINELTAQVAELRAGAGITDAQPEPEPETTTADSAETVFETPEIVEPVDEEPVFDWRTTDDVAALKQWALEDLGLEIKGNKKADTIRGEIREFLSLNDED